MRGVGLLLLAGCAGDLSIPLSPPELGTARSMVIGVEAEDLTVFAVELPAERIDVPVPPTESAEITAALYQDPLTALSLGSGLLPRASAQDEDTQLLPPSGTVFRATVDTDGATDWRTSGQLPEALASHRVRVTRPMSVQGCETVRLLRLSWPVDLPLQLLATLDGERGLVQANDRRFFAVGGADAEELTATSTTPFSFGGRAADGRIWLGAADGTIAELEGDTVIVRRRLPSITALSVSRSGPFRLYALDGAGTLHQFDGAAWQNEPKAPGATRLVARAESVVQYGDQPRYWAGEVGRFVEHSVMRSDLEQLLAIAFDLDGRGVAAGLTRSESVLLTSAGADRWVTALELTEVIDEPFLVVTNTGFINLFSLTNLLRARQVVTESGVCDEAPAGRMTPARVLPLGDNRYLLGGVFTDSSNLEHGLALATVE